VDLQPLQVDDIVLARYEHARGEKAWISGKIAAVVVDLIGLKEACYEVTYDDGDVEKGVAHTHITRVHTHTHST